MRRYTYPPDFNYVSAEDLESAMWRLARGVNKLDGIMRTGSVSGEYPQDEILALLEDMEAAAESLGPGNWPSNHPRISENVEVLRRDIYRARVGAQSRPPDYFFAGTVSGACLYCHSAGP